MLVVTDSTASLPAGAAERWGVEVVPLEVAVGDTRFREGVDLVTADLVAALTGGTPVTTSQPSPAAFARAYARAAERGAREIVSVHLSGELSGTLGAAEVAAAAAPVPVRVMDSRSVAMGLGAGVLAAAALAAGEPHATWTGHPGRGGAEAAAPGRGATEAPAGGAPAEASPGRGGRVDGAAVAERARAVAAAASHLFLVDSLEHLRRGGRIGSAAAAVGTLLGMRPLLTVREGRVEVAGKVRTRRAARERLVDFACTEAARRSHAVVAVHHLGQPDVADALATEVRDRLAVDLAAPGAAAEGPPVDEAVPDGACPTRSVVDVVVAEVSAVVGAHAGPGLLGVIVAEA